MVDILRAFRVGLAVACSNVDTAISKLKMSKFHCVIIDWMMPSTEGIELVHFIRKSLESTNPELPIIICTGLTDYARIVRARDAGVNEFIAKPFSVEELYRKLNAAIFRKRRFIEVKTYVGPDRRRQQRAFNGQDRRGRLGLSQDQIDDVMDDAPATSKTS